MHDFFVFLRGRNELSYHPPSWKKQKRIKKRKKKTTFTNSTVHWIFQNFGTGHLYITLAKSY